MRAEISEYYRKLDEVVIGKRKPVFLMERQSDKKVALVKPSYVATYGLQDSTGGLYVAASKTKGKLPPGRAELENKRGNTMMKKSDNDYGSNCNDGVYIWLFHQCIHDHRNEKRRWVQYVLKSQGNRDG